MKLVLFLVCIILKWPTFIRAENEEMQIHDCDCNIANKIKISDIVRPFATKSTQVTALGRVARLGDFYDARSDQFLGMSLYMSDLPGDAIASIDNAHTSIDFVKTESILEKFRKLGVQTSLTVSFLGGLVSVSGSGNYLNQDKKSSTSAKTSLVYRVKTVRDDLKIFSKSSKSVIDAFLLENVDATHVLVGMEWGANVVLSLEETNTDSTSYKDVQRNLENTLDEVVLSISNSSHTDREFDVEKSSTFSVLLNADIVSNTVPQTIKQSTAFLRDFPNLIKTQNDGKGKIVNYILMPVQSIRKLLKVDSNNTRIVNEMNPEIVDEFLKIFQEIKDSELLIKDASDSFDAWNFMVPEKERAEIKDFNRKIFSLGNIFRKRFADLVVLFRSDKAYDGDLSEFVSAYENSNYTLASVEKFLAGYEHTMDKIKLLNLLQSFNVSFINRKTDKYEIIGKNHMPEISLISADFSNISSPFVDDLITLVTANSRKGVGAVKYYIKDMPIKVPEIEMYLDGKVIQTCSYDEKWSSCFHDIIRFKKSKNKYLINKKEYIFLKNPYGKVIILDDNMQEVMRNDNFSEIAKSLATVVDDTFYNIDTIKGQIMSTAIENILNGLTAVNWSFVGSFPPEDKPIYKGVAVNSSFIYFGTYSGALYLYDTTLKTVNKIKTLTINHYCASLAVVDNILYIHNYIHFYSFDGTEVKEITTSEKRDHPGLFQLGSLVCRVGGNMTDIGQNPDPVSCYNPSDETWTVTSYINQYRVCPGVTSTESGIYIFGGRAYQASEIGDWLNSVEVFKPKSKIWSYVSSPLSKVLLSKETWIVQALTFYF